MIDISSGSNCNPHVADAMNNKRRAIVNYYSGMNQLFTYKNQPMYLDIEGIPIAKDPYGPKSRWCKPTQLSLQNRMRVAYETKDSWCPSYDMDFLKIETIADKLRRILNEPNA